MTIYRTSCGCIASTPEPSSCEFQTWKEFESALVRWEHQWQQKAREHERLCSKSARFQTAERVANRPVPTHAEPVEPVYRLVCGHTLSMTFPLTTTDDDFEYPVHGWCSTCSEQVEYVPGIERRYLAGVQSLLDRASLYIVHTSPARRVNAEHYADYDILVDVEIGDDVDGAHMPVPLPAERGQMACARFTAGLHVSGGGRVSPHTLYHGEPGTITVLSQTKNESTMFALIKRDRQELNLRVVNQLALERLELLR